jgi:hypothetical protein
MGNEYTDMIAYSRTEHRVMNDYTNERTKFHTRVFTYFVIACIQVELTFGT